MGNVFNHSVSCFVVEIMFRLGDCEIDAVDGSNRERGEHYRLRSLNIRADRTFAEFDITFYAMYTSLNHGQLEKSDERKF